jgi:hypothetical protein
VTPDPAEPAGPGHLVVCGDDALTSRMAEELTARYGEPVTVILPSAQRGHGPRIARLPGVRVVERAELDHSTFLAAGLQSARGLAILHQDDLGNFHAALRAQELNPDLRLVVAIFNTGLGERIRMFFADCAVLSDSAMAAPSFVAAALGEPAPSHIRLAGRTLYVARRADVSPQQQVWPRPPMRRRRGCCRPSPPATGWCSRSRTARPATRWPAAAVTRCGPAGGWP